MQTSYPSRRSGQGLAAAGRRHSAFTLTEVLIASTILGIAMTMTTAVLLASMKRAQHTENALKGTAELRYASDVISQAVRSAPQGPTVSTDGLKLYVPPKDVGFLVLQDNTWIDSAHTKKGTPANHRNMPVNASQVAVVQSWFKGEARPTGAISTGDLGTYFKTAPATWDVSDLVSDNDTVSIPRTSYGNAVATLKVKSVSQNPGTATITFTTEVGVDVPDGTRLTITSRQSRFEVTESGELRYYPDSRLATFTVLARDIDPSPLSDPADSSSETTQPFTIPTGSPGYVILNLQKIPKGTMAGRTLQGVQTTAQMRTNPTIP